MKSLTNALLGNMVAVTHTMQKDLEKDLTAFEKLKLRLAKKNNWVTLLTLGFAFAEKDPNQILASVGIVFQWFF